MKDKRIVQIVISVLVIIGLSCDIVTLPKRSAIHSSNAVNIAPRRTEFKRTSVSMTIGTKITLAEGVEIIRLSPDNEYLSVTGSADQYKFSEIPTVISGGGDVIWGKRLPRGTDSGSLTHSLSQDEQSALVDKLTGDAFWGRAINSSQAEIYAVTGARVRQGQPQENYPTSATTCGIRANASYAADGFFTENKVNKVSQRYYLGKKCTSSFTEEALGFESGNSTYAQAKQKAQSWCTTGISSDPCGGTPTPFWGGYTFRCKGISPTSYYLGEPYGLYVDLNEPELRDWCANAQS